jgi:hypothetical protein
MSYDIGFCQWKHQSPVAGSYLAVPAKQLEFVLHALQHVNKMEILFIAGEEGVCIPRWEDKTWLKSGRRFE